jgi:hypothetical protein
MGALPEECSQADVRIPGVARQASDVSHVAFLVWECLHLFQAPPLHPELMLRFG